MTTLQPRDDFRKSPHSKGWADLCSSPQFEDACKAAMLTMQLTVLSVPMDAESARDSANMLKGAHIFLRELMSLADSPPQTKPSNTGINYRA